MIGWQRIQIANEGEELARLQNRRQEVASTVAEMENKGRELDAKGVRFSTDTCKDEHSKKRLCVEIDKDAGSFTSADKSREFRVPKGF